MNQHDARRLALALPEAVETSHHGVPSWRIDKKIFATLPDDGHLHVMVAEEAIREAVALDPKACEEKWWGSRLAAVRITLEDMDEHALASLLREAWAMRAPEGLQEREGS